MSEIDFVIPWVNSNDIVWSTKRDKLLGKESNVEKENIGIERYRDYGTLKYLLRSIEKYASWVHHIYLITDNQIPNWLDLNKSSKISLIDHSDIIPKKFLPTFNSNVIELNAINIKGLSEKFVVFNDDLLINDYLKPTDFFLDGLPLDFRLYTSLQPYSDYDHILFNNNQLINKWLAGKYVSKNGLFTIKYGLQNIKNIYHDYFEKRHFVSNYALAHNAQAFRKQFFLEALDKWSIPVQTTMNNHFRSNSDVSILLVRDYQLEIGQFKPRTPKFSQYYVLTEINKIEKDLLNKQHKLMCINDTETDNYDLLASKIHQLLESKYPAETKFEKVN